MKRTNPNHPTYGPMGRNEPRCLVFDDPYNTGSHRRFDHIGHLNDFEVGDEQRHRSFWMFRLGHIRDIKEYQDLSPEWLSMQTFVIDIDGDTRASSEVQTLAISDFLKKNDAYHRLFYTGGRGFHIEIPATVFARDEWDESYYPAIRWRRPDEAVRKAKSFASQVAKGAEKLADVSIDIDWGLYSAKHKVRLEGGPRKNGRHKIRVNRQMLRGRSYLRYSYDLQKTNDWDFESYEQSPALTEMWEMSFEEGLVEVLVKSNLYGEVTNQSDLADAVEKNFRIHNKSRYKGEEVWKISCPFHTDRNPSAGFWASSGGFHCFSCGESSLQKLANKMGFRLERKTKKKDRVDDAYEELKEILMNAVRDDINILIKSPTAVGKTEIILSIIADLVEKNSAFLSVTHDLGEEVQERLRKKGKASNHLADILRLEPGCDDIEYNGPYEGETNYEAIKTLYKYDQSRHKICDSCEKNPNSDSFQGSPCMFLRMQNRVKNEAEQKSAIMATARLGYESSFNKLTSEYDLVVIDESCIDNLLSVSEFSIQELEKHRHNPTQVRVADGDTTTVGEIVSDILKDEWWRAKTLRQFLDRYERVLKQHETGLVYEEDHDLQKEFVGFELDVNQVDETITKFLSALNGNVTDIVKEGGSLFIRRVTVPDPSKQYIILDASVGEMDRHFYGTLFEDLQYEEIEAFNSSSTVFHDPSCTFSRSCQRRLLERHSDPLDEGFDRYQALVDFINSKEGSKCLITQKDAPFMGALLKDTDLEPEDIAWYGALRGLDRFSGRDHVFMVGDPGLPHQAYTKENVRYGIEEEDEKAKFALKRGYEAMNGAYVLKGLKSFHPQNRTAEHFYDKKIRASLQQAAGRSRSLRHSNNVWLFSSSDFDCDSVRYEVNPYLLTKSTSIKVETPEQKQAKWLANHSFLKTTEIMNKTGLSREDINGMRKKPLRQRRNLRIKELNKMGLTQKEIAEKTNCTRQTVSKVLNS